MTSNSFSVHDGWLEPWDSTEPLPRRNYYTGSPAVAVSRWAELGGVPARWLADHDALSARHQAALDWWATRCSPQAVPARILDRLAALADLCSR